MRQHGAKVLVQAMKNENIEYVFGIPGTHNIEMYDAMIDTPEIQPILVTDEQSASFMADGVARSTGNMAAINLVPGAALTHAMSGIAECYLDQIPLLIISSAVRNDTGASYQLHDVDQAAMARPVCKKVFKIRDFEDIKPMMSAACRLARTAPRGPVMVEVPANLLMLTTDKALPGLKAETSASKIDLDQVNHIAETLSQAKSIAIYAGLGARDTDKFLVDLADKLDALVFTSISGKGVFPEDHPRFAWNTMGRAAPKHIRRLEDGFDCILAIGCRFSEVATGSYGFQQPKKLIHIDIDRQVFNKNYSADISLTADAREAVGALLQSTALTPKTTNMGRLEILKKAHNIIHAEQNQKSETGRVTPAALYQGIQKEFGDDTVYVADSGNGLFLTMEYARLKKKNSFLAPVDYSCMGYSVPAAIGAKLANPDRPVVALVGDGAFLMTGLEMLTAVTYGAGVVFMILRDGKLSQISQFQMRTMNRETLTETPAISYAAMAKSLGLEFLTLETDAQASGVISEAAGISSTGKPVLLEVSIDYSLPTYFTQGVLTTNFLRFPWNERVRLVKRVIGRKLFGPKKGELTPNILKK